MQYKQVWRYTWDLPIAKLFRLMNADIAVKDFSAKVAGTSTNGSTTIQENPRVL